jgi:formylglycine-generating enzyme required for sulfatase activity
MRLTRFPATLLLFLLSASRGLPADAPAGPAPGTPWTAPSAGLEMIWCPPGNFTMGSPPNEDGRSTDYDETPHPVTLTHGYWLGKFLVTQSQWEKLMGTTIAQQRDLTRYPTWPIVGQGTDYPIYYVSWDEAVAFCQKLTAQERAAGRLPPGWHYALPTEAQWEYACRAGTTGATYAGELHSVPAEDGARTSATLDPIAWYLANSDKTTHPVGQKLPNPWGFYDLLGNEGEWCADWYGVYPTGAVTDPTGPAKGRERVIRGQHTRAAYRFSDLPDMHSRFHSFRVALVEE